MHYITLENRMRVAPFNQYHDFANHCLRNKEFGLSEEEFTTLKAMETDSQIVLNTVNQIEQKSRGLGDTVAKVTKFFGIEPCGGCKQRQEILNDLVPYKVA